MGLEDSSKSGQINSRALRRYLTQEGVVMKKTKSTEEQIAFAPHQAQTGVSVEEICRKTGVS